MGIIKLAHRWRKRIAMKQVEETKEEQNKVKKVDRTSELSKPLQRQGAISGCLLSGYYPGDLILSSVLDSIGE
jgi:hypothetical protein